MYSCNEGPTEVATFTDLDVLQDIIIFNENLSNYTSSELGSQEWDDEGRLISLNLNDFDISTLPNSIGDLSELTYLNLSDNLISSIPSTIGELENLNYNIS